MSARFTQWPALVRQALEIGRTLDNFTRPDTSVFRCCHCSPDTHPKPTVYIIGEDEHFYESHTALYIDCEHIYLSPYSQLFYIFSFIRPCTGSRCIR